jgi:glutathione S-transferase
LQKSFSTAWERRPFDAGFGGRRFAMGPIVVACCVAPESVILKTRSNRIMLTVHHLGMSQSERIVWLCEELQIPYEIKRYERDSVTRLAPPELKAVHPLGNAPVITDGDLVLAESAAIVDYIIGRHGNGRLALRPGHPDFANYLYWFHFANGNLQPILGRNMALSRLKLPEADPIFIATKGRLERVLGLVDARLGEAPFLAGSEFTAADIMTVFSLTTMRYFLPLDLTPYPRIREYLGRISEREGYRDAMRKGDPGMALLLA